MEEPIMEEEDLVNIINKQRHGKAAGVDGVKAEVMKHMIKNRRIKLHLLRSFNNCLKEKVNDDWLLSNTTMIAKNKKPMILDFRPLAVITWSSKIACTYYRENRGTPQGDSYKAREPIWLYKGREDRELLIYPELYSQYDI